MDIRILNLTKKYGDRDIFRNFSLSIGKGKVTALMGKSGLGKTTLMRILMGLEKYDSGEIEGLEGIRIGAVFQEDRLCENLSSVTNVAIACDRKVTKEMIERELERTGLKGSLHKPVRELSGGMKRRVAIVRSVMSPSDILIFDEPFKGLDSETKEDIVKYLKERIGGRTVILITHDIREAEIFGSNVINL